LQGDGFHVCLPKVDGFHVCLPKGVALGLQLLPLQGALAKLEKIE
jgi:hypothetical protein